MRDFGIGAASLGNLSAFYFYFYVALQIPVGALTNSWGPRKLLVCGAISAAAGQCLFGITSNFALACAGNLAEEALREFETTFGGLPASDDKRFIRALVSYIAERTR